MSESTPTAASTTPGLPQSAPLASQREGVLPSRLVGFVIGTRGETLRGIEHLYGVQIRFDTPQGPNEVDRRFVVIGPEEKLEAALNAVIAKSKEAPNQAGPPATSHGVTAATPAAYAAYPVAAVPTAYPMMPMYAAAPAVMPVMAPSGSFSMAVPSVKVGLVIGRSGETVRDIQNKTGARVQVGPESERLPNGDRYIHILGDPLAVQRAREMILEIVNGPDRMFGAGAAAPPAGAVAPMMYATPYAAAYTAPTAMTPLPASSAGPMGLQRVSGGDYVLSFRMSNDVSGFVIGRGGENLKSIQRISNVRISIDPGTVAGTNERIVRIYGAPEACLYAAEQLREKVHLVNRRDGRPQGHGITGLDGNVPVPYSSSNPAPNAAPIAAAPVPAAATANNPYAAQWAAYYAQLAATGQSAPVNAVTPTATSPATSTASTQQQLPIATDSVTAAYYQQYYAQYGIDYAAYVYSSTGKLVPLPANIKTTAPRLEENETPKTEKNVVSKNDSVEKKPETEERRSPAPAQSPIQKANEQAKTEDQERGRSKSPKHEAEPEEQDKPSAKKPRRSGNGSNSRTRHSGGDSNRDRSRSPKSTRASARSRR